MTVSYRDVRLHAQDHAIRIELTLHNGSRQEWNVLCGRRSTAILNTVRLTNSITRVFGPRRPKRDSDWSKLIGYPTVLIAMFQRKVESALMPVFHLNG